MDEIILEQVKTLSSRFHNKKFVSLHQFVTVALWVH